METNKLDQDNLPPLLEGNDPQDATLEEVIDQRTDAILDNFSKALTRTGASYEHIKTETKRALRDSVIDPYVHESEGWKKAYFDNVDFQTNAAVRRALEALKEKAVPMDYLEAGASLPSMRMRGIKLRDLNQMIYALDQKGGKA